MVEISRRNPGECIEGKDDAIEGNPSFRTIVKVVNALGGRIVVESMSTGANGIRIKGSKVGLYKENGKALKTTGRDE